MMASSGDDVLKLQQRLSLLREEYIKLQKRLSDVEKQNSILLNSSKNSESNISFENNKTFIGRILDTVANLVNEEKYSDVKIRLASSDEQETEIFGHKFILATRNELWGREDVGILDWTDVPYNVGRAVIQWIYTNDTPSLSQNDTSETLESEEKDNFVLTLMKTAKKFNLLELMKTCEEFLVSKIQIRNCIRYYTTAEDLGAEVLRNHCSKLISMHWDDFTFDDFTHMSAALLYAMFKEKTEYPLHFAIRMRREDVVFLYLIEFSQMLTAKLNETDEKGLLTLDLALSTGQEDLALNLIEHKVNVNQKNTLGSNSLHSAITRGDTRSAIFLLEHGSDVNMPDNDLNYPLHLVLMTEDNTMANVTEMLLDLGANLDVQNKDLMTPLHLSIRNNNPSIFSLLLKNSSNKDLEIKDGFGYPPMWYALENLQTLASFHREENASVPPNFFASELVAAGANPNPACDSDKNTLLHIFSARSSEKAASHLVENLFIHRNQDHVSSIDVVNAYGETALHATARGRLCNIAKSLLQQGANPNIQTNSSSPQKSNAITSCTYRETPLHIASTNGDYTFIKMFLESSIKTGPSLNSHVVDLALRDSNGNTALRIAMENSYFDTAEILISAGADVNELDSHGVPLLQQFILCKNHESSSFLIVSGHADVNLRASDSCTSLELAIKMRLLNVIEILCQFGADMSLSSDPSPPLWMALSQEDEPADDIAAILVRHGVDTDIWVDGPDGCEQTLLHKAIDENRISAAIFLIRAGCDLDSPRRPGTNGIGGDEARDLATPLHLCCQWGIEQVVETLLEHGASLNAKDVEGKTPLHAAIEAGNQDIANKLIEQNGIDLCARDKAGLSPFATAMTFKNQKAAQKILQLEPSAADQLDSRGRNFLHTAILKDDLEAVLFLISVQANVNTRTQDPSSLSGGHGSGGLTPLMLAVSKGNTMIVRNLILAGATVTDVTPTGQTTLQIAAENGLAEVCSILLSNGVDYSVTDNRGNNALHSSVKEGHSGVTRILLTESSIDAEATNNKGRNPLHILANFGRPETSVEIFQLFNECMPEYPLNRPDTEGNTALLLSYMKGNGSLCRALVKSGGVALGTLNHAEVSIFNCAVASKSLLSKILDYLSIEPKWGEGDLCQECKQKFGITTRKHHCRHCGRLLCSKCSDKEMPIIKYGISKPARVCDICSDVLTIGIAPQ